MKKWYSNIYSWSVQTSNSSWGVWILLLCGIADGSFFPLPVTTILLAFILLNPRSIIKFVIFLTVGISIGAIAGYLTGHFAWLDSSGHFTGLARFFVDNLPGFSVEGYEKIQHLFSRWGSGILLFATTTPVPYGLFAVSSGVFNIHFAIFIIATMAGHFAKFFFLGFAAKRMGPSVTRLLELSFKPVTVIAMAGAVVVVVILKL